jgi:phosphoglycerate kinase
MKTIRDMPIEGQTLLIRVDFNVPLDEKLAITDDARIRGALPTLEYALDKGAKVILASHLGRPKGLHVPQYSLAPVADRLSALLRRPVKMAPDCVGEAVSRLAMDMQPGDVLLLENLRFHAEEQANDQAFARQLASLCDIYINDAFAVSHRANASVVAITSEVSRAAAGLLLKKELDFFASAFKSPQRPLVAIVGGAKVSSKLNALKNMLQQVDKVIIGGAMANTFLQSMGLNMEGSLVEEEMIPTARALRQTALNNAVKLYLPIDVMAAQGLETQTPPKVALVQEIPPGWMALDIGPATVKLYSEAIATAGTIIWNGPMGVFETAPFEKGTFAVAKAVASADAVSIVGGGDTDAALHQSGQADKVSFISTGGGAFLTLMEGKSLPAVLALENE